MTTNNSTMERKNDKGEKVPSICDKCGGKVCVQIKGEPIFVCSKCGKYFGTVPFSLKENAFFDKISPATDREIDNFLLSEERHFPDFLDSLVRELSKCVFDAYSLWLYLGGKENQPFQREYQLKNNTYCDSVVIAFQAKCGQDIRNDALYRGEYLSDGFDKRTNKLKKVSLSFVVPATEEKSISRERVTYIVAHETEHLFDDWLEQKDGRLSITDSPRSLSNGNLYRNLQKSSKELERAIGYAGYLAFFSEEKAFATETYYELTANECTDLNYKDTLKKCQGYQYYKTLERNIIPAIKQASEEDLERLNEIVMRREFIFSAIPTASSFQTMDEYREKLILWAKRLSKRFLKRFFGIVSLFVDDYKQNNPRVLPPAMSFSDYEKVAKSL